MWPMAIMKLREGSLESATLIHWHLSGLSSSEGERLGQLLTVRWAE
jgi:hypothetical protein